VRDGKVSLVGFSILHNGISSTEGVALCWT